MILRNNNHRLSSASFKRLPPSNRLAQRVQSYFARHPEASQEDFLQDAVGKEIDFRDQLDQRVGPWFGHRQALGTNDWFAPPAPTAEDIRMHAWIDERLAQLHRERYGVWSRVRRFLFGNRLFRWLASNRREL
jgi:hypothetical protein